MFKTIQHLNQEEGFTFPGILAGIGVLGAAAAVLIIPGFINVPEEKVAVQAVVQAEPVQVPADGMQATAITGGTTYNGKILAGGSGADMGKDTGKTYKVTHAYNAATKTVTYELVLSEAMTGEGIVYFGDGKQGMAVGVSIKNGVASGNGQLSMATSTSVTYEPAVGEFKTTTGTKYIL